MDYNQTLNLPKTEFPMRASLPQREPEFLKAWEENKQYEELMKHNADKPMFLLHDGPPYANGDIHIGHALNKTLKDFIVRYKNMTGFKSPYVPGWDTHGLPTELAARKKAGISATSDISDLELRKICRETALGYVDIQRESFKRLGAIGEWDNPYITLQKEFEQEQIKVFASMANKGYIYKGLKPVYWCPDCNTALAEAEIEYGDDPCHSIYVKFKVTDDMGKLEALGADLDKTYFVIWTTTTWTLPANLAICVGPNYEYSLLKANGEYYVMATDLAGVAMEDAGISDYETVGIIRGNELEYMKTAHPFIDRTSLVIVGDHVTLESGTGCVHTAPGHGVDDFIVCKNYPEIPIVVPVDDKGYLTEEAGQFAGLSTDEANKPIAEHLEKTGNLFALKKIKHQYPHCWRCHKPIIFRATSQWFCSVDAFKDDAVKAAEDVKWFPEWGKDRLQSMVQERADWCISRQRKWGVPIPVIYCKDCGK
ncbi:MAG: class I tRNA ligase family protein, partial [Eubacterium sp.]|nr:class I tRNA ligase family protein [Eubacterium sp.]